MTQASVNIAQQFLNGGVVPADLVGQSAASKKYVDDQLAIRDANISAAAGAASAAQADIDAHETSTTAHPAQNITYSGKVTGAGDVRQAIDAVKTTLDQAIVSGDSGPEAKAARYSTPQNKTYDSLKDRLDASDVTMEGKVNRSDVFNDNNDIIMSRVGDVVTYQEGYAVVGVPHNLHEKVYVYPNRIRDGHIYTAPLAVTPSPKDVDIIAHWYNDFGLEYTACVPNAEHGSYSWYDWRWNHTYTVGYDPHRHPILGWYRGDDANVLDWQCYWLIKYGVQAVSLVSDFSSANWSDPGDLNYWIYQLFNNCKNFKSLKYIMWLQGDLSMTIAEANAQQDDIFDNIVTKYSNVYTYNLDGKRYATFFVWDMASWRGLYDEFLGNANSVKRFKDIASKMKTLGYDGVCILGRNLDDGSFNENTRNDLKASGVLLYGAEYGDPYGTNETYSNSYSNYADNAVFPTASHRVLNVVTSLESKSHPSAWNLQGSTPALFERILHRAYNSILKNDQPKMIMVYNVSEWAEGGPGLQPNKADGFGYLQSLTTLPTNKSVLKNGVFPNSNDFFVARLDNITLQVGANYLNFGPLPYHNYIYNKSDFSYSVTLDYTDGDDHNVRYTVTVSFADSRVYLTVYNNSTSIISGVGASLMIRKINPS